jgi:hypothetical protein
MRSGRRHRLRRSLIALGVIIVVFLTLTAVLFVFPSTNAPRRSNAIVVLGGSGPDSRKDWLSRAPVLRRTLCSLVTVGIPVPRGRET